MVVDIKDIESAYKRKHDVKKINKKTKKWKKFYNAYRKKNLTSDEKYLLSYYKSKDKPKSKPKKEPEKQTNSMKFNGKWYNRSARTFSTKEEAKRSAKESRAAGLSVILDKRKSGYIFWIRNK